MSPTFRPARRTTAALLALTLLVVACGSRVPELASDRQPAPVAEVTLPATTEDEVAAPEIPDVEVPPEPEEAEVVEDPAPAPEPEEAEDLAGDEVVAQQTENAAADDPARQVGENAWTPFAAVEGIVLHHPSSRVERVGFHEANHDGARQLEVLDGAIAAMTLDTRGRSTGSRSAADVVVDPDVEVRAPVTGTVLRAGTYVLYCDYSDDYVVMEADARPGWEVKLLHIDGVQVTQGQRVVAGETVLAPRPTPLPFESQVDEHTAEPSWPHVHIEVVDPSIPNESSGGGC